MSAELSKAELAAIAAAADNHKNDPYVEISPAAGRNVNLTVDGNPTTVKVVDAASVGGDIDAMIEQLKIDP